jgi:hypothetical protein
VFVSAALAGVVEWIDENRREHEHGRELVVSASGRLEGAAVGDADTVYPRLIAVVLLGPGGACGEVCTREAGQWKTFVCSLYVLDWV